MKEEVQRLVTEWEASYEDLKQQAAMYQEPATKDLSRAVLCQGKAVSLGQCVVALHRLLADTPESVSPSSDPNQGLTELYQRVVQTVLQVPATVDEDGDIKFEYPGFNTFYIDLDESMPELMNLDYIIGRNETYSHEALSQICNHVNLTPWPVVLTVDESQPIVWASVRLFLAAEGRIPDEGLVKAVFGQAMSVIAQAVEQFMKVQTER